MEDKTNRNQSEVLTTPRRKQFMTPVCHFFSQCVEITFKAILSGCGKKCDRCDKKN